MYKLLIVDDEPLMQVGIKSMINCEELDITVTGLANNGESALAMIEKEMPDIVICDIKMPVMSGLELIKICCERYGYGVPVFIFLTSYEEFTLAKQAVAYQACDYLIKLELTPQMLSASLKKAMSLVKKPVGTDPAPELEGFLKNEEKFYIRLLQNMFESREQFELQCAFLDIHLKAPAYQCIYLEFIDQSPLTLSDDKLFSLYASCFTMICELLPKYIKGKAVSLDIKHCAILLEKEAFDINVTDDNENMIRVFAQLNDSIHRYYNVRFYAGIGSIESKPLDFCVSYQNAKHAFTHTDDDHPLQSYTALPKEMISHDTFNLSLFRDELSHSIAEYDEIQFVQVIDNLCDIFAEHPTHVTQAMDASCSILYMVISSIPDGEQTVTEMFSEYTDHYRSVYRQRTTQQIIDWLRIFAKKVSDYFTDRKSNHTNYTVNMVKQYIGAHLSEKLTLNEVASIFNITPNYLSQLFKKYSDVGFNEYVTVAKISEAKNMLAGGKMKIYEISDALGFESSFYFSKVFKKTEGLSPKEYIHQKLS